MIKVIAFDVFNTVFDLSTVDHQEIRDYANHIRQEKWSPLVLPKSWEALKAHPDSAEGINMLRDREYMVVTCSNGPLGLLAKLSKHNGICWDAITPLEMFQVFKPHKEAYLSICHLYDVLPSEVMMVTANKTFGDIEASRSLGMEPMFIRGESRIKTIIDLACLMKYRNS